MALATYLTTDSLPALRPQGGLHRLAAGGAGGTCACAVSLKPRIESTAWFHEQRTCGTTLPKGAAAPLTLHSPHRTS
jgi:hypothetical protein